MAEEREQPLSDGASEAVVSARVMAILADVKCLAQEYYELTAGRVLGVTGQIAEYEASKRLGLILAPPGTAGYNASRGQELIQITGRRVPSGKLKCQRIGGLDHFFHRVHALRRVGAERWHTVVLVMLDEHFEPTAIYEATRSALEVSLHRLEREAKERDRAKQGMAVSEFMTLGRRIRPDGG